MLRPAQLALLLSLMSGATQAATVHVEDNRPIPRYSCSYYCYGYSVDPILIDMDGDGLDDVWMRGYGYSSSRSSGSSLTVSGRNGAVIESGPMHGAGDVIDANLTYQTSVVPTGYSYRRGRFGRSTRTFSGTWGDGTSGTRQGFIGLTLGSGAFGWLEMSLDGYGSGRLLAWGYEREIGVGIAAGAAQTYVEPVVLAAPDIAPVPLPASGVLLAGALGGLVLRRRARARGL